jgi:hypothetical protein
MQNYTLRTEKYSIQKDIWPASGRHILAQFTDDAILVYQAYNDKIADYAVEHQKLNGPDWSTTRMTWIKTNFCWMMFRADWGKKSNQNRILGLWIKRESFEKYVAMGSGKDTKSKGTVRLQWDPDHLPSGDRHGTRKAIQLGLKNVDTFINGSDIVRIDDLTQFVAAQREFINKKKYDDLITPEEKIYTIQGVRMEETGTAGESIRITLSYRNKQKVVVIYSRDEDELLDMIYQKFKVKAKTITLPNNQVVNQQVLNTLPQGSTLLVYD